MVSKEREIAVSKTINGHLLHLSSNGLWVNSEGDSGYHTRLTGAWVCYVCGHLCECGDRESKIESADTVWAQFQRQEREGVNARI